MSAYTAEDFANAKFAEHKDGRVISRCNPASKYAWENNRGDLTDAEMADEGWVPAPTKPTITESEYRLALDEDRDPQYVYGFIAAMRLFGGEVIPDPEPTSKEKWVTFRRNVTHFSLLVGSGSGMTSPPNKRIAAVNP